MSFTKKTTLETSMLSTELLALRETIVRAIKETTGHVVPEGAVYVSISLDPDNVHGRNEEAKDAAGFGVRRHRPKVVVSWTEV